MTAAPTFAHADDRTGFVQLSYACPNPLQIDFSWTAADNASFYSLQLAKPVDASQNGGVGGTFLPQFGTTEVVKGQAMTVSVNLAQAALPSPIAMQWQVMVGGRHGYTGLVTLQEIAMVSVPCDQTATTTTVIL